MKRTLIDMTASLAVLLLCAMVSSCSKEDPAGLNVDIIKSLAAVNQLPVADGATVVADGRLLFASGSPSAFFARLNGLQNHDVDVTARIDTDPALLRIYDSLYHTTSPALPQGFFKLAKDGRCTIKAGQYQSTDSIGVIPDDISGLNPGTYRYVVPVRVESKPAGLLKSPIMFVRYNVTVAGAYLSNSWTGKAHITMTAYSVIPQMPLAIIRVNLGNAISTVSKYAVEAVNSAELAEAYNARYQTAYKPFPADAYTFPSDSITISAGALSPATGPVFRPDPTRLPTGSTYVMAFRIRFLGGESQTVEQLLGSNQVMYAIINAVP